MCTHASHTVINGSCFCGVYKDGLFCAMRSYTRSSAEMPPMFKADARSEEWKKKWPSNENCCKNEIRCERIPDDR